MDYGLIAMPKFHYTAKKGPKDIVEGVLEADNRSGVLAHLAQLGYVPVRVFEQANGAAPHAAHARAAAEPSHPVRIGRISRGQIALFTRQFASLVRAHVPLLRSFNILEQQSRHPYLRHILRELAEDVRQGETLSQGLSKFPRTFPPLFVHLVRSGEATGALDMVLERLAQQAEQEELLRSRVRAAFTYPAFVAVVGALTVTFLMTFVMPRLADLLAGLGQRLPAQTRVLLAVSATMSSRWFWIEAVAAALGGAIGWRALGTRAIRWRDRALLRVPLIGTLIQHVELARFARTLGLQLDHGIPILQAVDTAIAVVEHRVLREELATVPEGLRQGTPLSSCLQGLRLGSPLLVNTILIGEESGRVGESLTQVAGYYERDIERSLQTMATLLEPTLIVGVGLVVGFIVMAVLLPIFEMSSINP